MSQIYQIVRIVNLVLSIVVLVPTALDLVKLIDSQSRDLVAIVSLALTGVVLFLCAYGSYRHDRPMLLTFAVIAFVTIIVGFVTKENIYISLGLTVVLAVLSLVQSELIKRGHR